MPISPIVSQVAAARTDATAEDSWLFSSTQIDLQGVRLALMRNRWFVLAICCAGFLLGLSVTLLTTPVYRAEASLQIDQQASRVLEAPDVQPVQAVQDADRFLQTQIEILRSRALAMRVAEALGLYRDGAFLDAMRVDRYGGAAAQADADVARREQVLATLRDNLNVTLPDGSRIARITFDSPDPALAAKIANAFADAMIAHNLARRFDTSGYARQFLREQLAQAKERLEESERSMVAYARSAGIIDTGAIKSADQQANGTPSLVGASLVDANEALSQARTRRIDAEQFWRNAQATSPMSLPDILSHPAVQMMMERRVELEASYAEQNQRRQHDHPDLIRLRAQIAALDQRLLRLAGNIRDSIRNRFVTAELQERQMQAEVDRLKDATLTEQDRSIRYTILRREVRTNRELYDGLLQRFKQVSTAAGVSSNNIAIVDLASPSTRPVAPKLVVNLGLALLASLVVALGFVYLRENLDDAVGSVEQLESKLGVTGLGMLPRLEAGLVFREELEKRSSALTEAVHTFRSTIELSDRLGAPRTIFVTSCGKGEGKTSITYALARDFAQTGRRVLLVDADMRRPSMHKLFALENQGGLADLLRREVEIVDVARPTTIPNLEFIAAGGLVPNPAELLAQGTLPWLIEQFEERYDLVLLDGPPVLGLADAPSIAAHVEATLFVVDNSQANRRTIRAALRRLHLSRAVLRGIVLNRVEVRAFGYGHAYYDYSHDAAAAARKRAWLSLG